MSKLDLTGQVFGRLTVIEAAGKTKRKEVLWKCKCECGNYTNVTTYRLRKGETKSCGCLNIDTSKRRIAEIGKANKTHGMSKTRVYKTYRGIRERCLNKSSKKYKDYGGRGIKLSDEWNTFEKFYEWSIENGYIDSLTLDRKDVDGNYEPNNCRWVDMTTQSNNKRNNRKIEYNGEVKTLSEWATEYGLDSGTLGARIDRYKMDIETALTTPKKVNGKWKAKTTIEITDIETLETKTYQGYKEVVDAYSCGEKTIKKYENSDKLFRKKYKIVSHKN